MAAYFNLGLGFSMNFKIMGTILEISETSSRYSPIYERAIKEAKGYLQS